MARRIVGHAAGLTPSIVLPGRRQSDGLVRGGEIGGDVFLLNDGNAFARQGHLFFGEGIEVLEFGQARQARPLASRQQDCAKERSGHGAQSVATQPSLAAHRCSLRLRPNRRAYFAFSVVWGAVPGGADTGGAGVDSSASVSIAIMMRARSAMLGGVSRSLNNR